MKILGLTKFDTSNFGLAALRIIWPFQNLNKLPGFDCVTYGNQQIKSIAQSGRMDAFAGFDLVVLHRLVYGRDGSKGFFDALHSMGAKIVFEVDDDIADREGLEDWYEATVSQCDAVTVSTPHLGGVMTRYNKPIHVLPNHLDTKWFGEISTGADRYFDGPVIGLVGTRSHWEDWIKVLPALQKIEENYPGVTIACAGFVPPYLEDNISRLKIFAAVHYNQYPALIRQFDILLSPLDQASEFNHSKSGISALDAMAAARPVGKKQGGAVAVCTDCRAYRRVVNDKANGLLIKNDEDWYDAIVSLIEDRALRTKLQVNGLKWVKKNRDISRGAKLWAKAYREIAG